MKIKKAIEILEGVALENEITPEIDEAICLVVEDAKKNLSNKKQKIQPYKPKTFDELVAQQMVRPAMVIPTYTTEPTFAQESDETF